MSHPPLSVATRAGQGLVVTARAAKPARFATNQIRLDFGDDVGTNGETLVQRFALKNPAPVVLDVEAHHGEWSLSLLEQRGRRPILHLFEPSEGSAVLDRAGLKGLASVHQVGLLKVDAEGHDFAVLRGVETLLASGSIDLVQFVYNLWSIDSRTFLLDAFQLLHCHGYSVDKVTPLGFEVYPRWHPELEKFVEGDYLAFLPARSQDLLTTKW